MVALATPLWAQVETFARGDRVLLDSAPGARAQIIALPGDRVQFSRDAILVNDQPVTDAWVRGIQPMLPPFPTELTVPVGQYFIAAERRTPFTEQRSGLSVPASSTVRSLGLIPANNVARQPSNP